MVGKKSKDCGSVVVNNFAFIWLFKPHVRRIFIYKKGRRKTAFLLNLNLKYNGLF